MRLYCIHTFTLLWILRFHRCITFGISKFSAFAHILYYFRLSKKIKCFIISIFLAAFHFNTWRLNMTHYLHLAAIHHRRILTLFASDRVQVLNKCDRPDNTSKRYNQNTTVRQYDITRRNLEPMWQSYNASCVRSKHGTFRT